jgi:hypothetical protein
MDKVPPEVKKEILEELSKEDQEKLDLEKSLKEDFDGPKYRKGAVKENPEEPFIER